jgi:serine-type D-Ala-D-Ala carboxypeptidase (penicillin-binding protein 5/6)
MRHETPRAGLRAGLRPALFLSFLLALAAAAALPAGAAAAIRAPAGLKARAAILVDQATGRVLYQKNADQPFVPASLAKLMALHIVWEKLENRSIRPDDVVFITSRAFASSQEPGSSLMRLEPGQVVTVMDLVRGTAIASGNDAATALAEFAAGSVQKFVGLMNDEARWLGYSTMRFVDPAGLSRDNVVTAREFADFCRRYVEWHPQALAEVHSLREFYYPLPRNIPAGSSPFVRSSRVYNPNYLVWDPFGVDGLKTGHLDDGNFTAALTARRGDTRLIAVLLGIPGDGLTEGAKNRSADGMALFSWGFRSYSTVRLPSPPLDPVRVWKGERDSVAVQPEQPLAVTVSAAEKDRIVTSLVFPSPLVAPVTRGQRVGELVLSAGGAEVGRVPLAAADAVAGAGPLKKAWHSLRLAANQLFLPSQPR